MKKNSLLTKSFYIVFFLSFLSTVIPVRGIDVANSYIHSESDLFTDIYNYHYAEAIVYVKNNGIVDGYADSTFKPNDHINRAEFTKILVQTAYPDEIKSYIATSCFKDISENDWFAKYVCFAKDKNIISGYNDGTFKPSQSINVAEAEKITLSAFFPSIPNATGPWYQKYINYSFNQGFAIYEWSDVNRFITRGEMAEFIYKIKTRSINQISEENPQIKIERCKNLADMAAEEDGKKTANDWINQSKNADGTLLCNEDTDLNLCYSSYTELAKSLYEMKYKAVYPQYYDYCLSN